MNQNKLANIINLLKVPGMGTAKVRNLIARYPDYNDWFSLSVHELCQVESINLSNANSIKSFNGLDYGEKEIELARKRNTYIVSLFDDNYPHLLKKIYNPPVLLYVKGKPLKAKYDSVSIVGSRKNTSYGKAMASTITSGLVKRGLVITSGLARGIDTIAHKESVRNNGCTLAVLGSGLDVIYPRENNDLAKQIQQNGSLISEFPFGTGPDAQNFPRRNRIISGLSHGTIVVEAGNKSGAILTALNAVDQNREVFAVPGRVTDSQSIGTLRLIRNGAVPYHDIDQVLSHIESRLFKVKKPIQQKLNFDLNADEKHLYTLLSGDSIHIDKIAEITKVSITKCLAILLNLELMGIVQQQAGKHFIAAHDITF